MIGLEQAIDLLASDVKIVDATARSVGAQGTHTLRFPGDWMPDGKDFLGEVPEKLDPSILKEWCNAVRREFDARIKRKEAEEVSRRRLLEASAGNAAGGAANQTGPDSYGTASDGKAGEADMESYLQAEVTKWARRQREKAEALDALNDRARELKEELLSCSKSYDVAVKMLEYYRASTNS